MRAVALILALLLAGCSSEPSFDERYSTAEKDIREKAAEMDKEMAAREREASEAAARPSTAATGQPSSSMKAPK